MLFEAPLGSGTATESPVVADVDGDGKAEVVVGANGNAAQGLFVFGDPTDRWVATRPLWNQHTYHVTNVTDDGGIPARERNSWEVHNTYRQNLLLTGCAYALPDLTASFVRKSLAGSEVVLTARIGNRGGNPVGASTPVSFYGGDPSAGGTLLGTVLTTRALGTGGFEDVALTVPAGTAALPLWVVADDEGGLVGIRPESDETNNAHDARIYLTAAPNQAPQVSATATPDFLSLPEDTVQLAGTATDDGLPIGELRYTWGVVSGPGRVTFADPAGRRLS